MTVPEIAVAETAHCTVVAGTADLAYLVAAAALVVGTAVAPVAETESVAELRQQNSTRVIIQE